MQSLFTPPQIEPVTLAEAKAQARFDHDDENDLFTRLIAAARELAEQLTGRALITQTWDLLLDGFPDGEIRLPLPPLQAVISITYLDGLGVEQTLATSAYRVLRGEPARIVPIGGWPVTLTGEQTVTVRMRCGYGDDAASVPAPIRQWMLEQVASRFDNREAIVVTSRAGIMSIDDIGQSSDPLAPYRFRTVF